MTVSLYRKFIGWAGPFVTHGWELRFEYLAKNETRWEKLFVFDEQPHDGQLNLCRKQAKATFERVEDFIAGRPLKTMRLSL